MLKTYCTGTSSGDSGGIDEITEDEFEALLDELHGSGAPGQSSAAKSEPAKAAASAAASDNDDITDEEFEALLDDLHGKGKFVVKAAPTANTPAPAPVTPSAAGDEEITDDEFEALLTNCIPRQGAASREPFQRRQSFL